MPVVQSTFSTADVSAFQQLKLFFFFFFSSSPSFFFSFPSSSSSFFSLFLLPPSFFPSSFFTFLPRGSGLPRKGVPPKTQRGKRNALAAVCVGTGWRRVKGGGRTETNVKNNNESFGAQVPKFSETADSPRTILGPCAFIPTESLGTWKWNFVLLQLPAPRVCSEEGR